MSCIRCLHGADWRDHVEEGQLGCTPLCERCRQETLGPDESEVVMNQEYAALAEPTEGPFACGFCDKETKSARGMRRHIAAVHPGFASAPEGGE